MSSERVMSSEMEKKLEGCTEDERILLTPLVRTTRTYYLFFALFAVLFLCGIGAYIAQFRYGLGVTGLNKPSYWGIYIIDFVFFIGISHAGTLISAILRISKAEWRRSITRSAEFITVLVIGFGAIQPIVDLGRPDRVLNVLFHGHVRSPLLWDVTSIGLYFTASTIYLYVPMIPDLARIRDLGLKAPWLYRTLALGYRGTPEQERLLERIIMVLAILVIPVAISVHTVIGWIFALTLRPGWHSTIFGPYFVIGAIYSGIAALLIAMTILRKVYRLENYFKDIHFNNMGTLLLVMSLLWFYFTFAEYITVFYGQEVAEMRAFWDKFTGTYAPYFWLMVISCFVVPFALMARRKTRTPRGTCVASCFVVLGMWLERFNIVVPTSVNPRLELYGHGSYIPSLVEILILVGTFSGFVLVYMIATKFFPIISIWEIREGRERSVAEVTERVTSYLPDDTVEPAAS
jgi:molybdopterin-containing oxidoreductase family membrane subunit